MLLKEIQWDASVEDLGDFFFFFWLRRVLVVAQGIFVVVRGLLSSCGVWVFSSLAVVHRVQGAWAL